MSREINVTTSYANGTFISMSAPEMKSFLVATSIHVITWCNEMIVKVDESFGTILENTSKIPEVDNLIEEYVTGVHGAVLSNILQTDIEILFSIVQDAVLNKTIAGFYLLWDKTKKGKTVFDLILRALEEYDYFIDKEYSALKKARPRDSVRYTQYNEEFRRLLEKSDE